MSSMNTALVFLKPHAATATVEDFVKDHLSKRNVSRPPKNMQAQMRPWPWLAFHMSSSAAFSLTTKP